MKLTSIQMLRGVAAFIVMLAHILEIEQNSIAIVGGHETAIIAAFWEKGFAGVDLFFVISGFIMVYVTAGRERGATSALDFLVTRASRIYPLWWLFMAVMAIYFLSTYGVPGDPDEFLASGNTANVYLLKSIFLLPQAGHPTLGVGWTLIHEMYFYVVFAAFLFAPPKWLPVLLATWAIFVIGCDYAGWTNYFPGNLLELANYPITLEFIAGAFVALLVMSGRRAFAVPLTIIAAVALITAIIVYSNDDTQHTLKWGRVLWFGLPATVLIYGITSWEADGGWERLGWSRFFRSLSSRVWRLLVKLGDISFALYLCHMICLGCVRQSMKALAALLENMDAPQSISSVFRLGAPGMLDNLVFVLTSITVSVIVALASYRFFEQPSLSYLAKIRKRIFPPIAAPNRGEMVRDKIW